MLVALNGDITKIEGVNFICNAANPQGIMGAGVAGAIAKAGGEAIGIHARQICRGSAYHAGDLYVTTAGDMPYAGVIHLASVPAPGKRSSLRIVELCLKNLANFALVNKIPGIAIPLLGTGIGRLNPADLKPLYTKYLNEHPTKFVVVEYDLATFNAYVRA